MMASLLLISSLAAFVFTAFATIFTQSLRDFSRHEMEQFCEKKANSTRLGEILHWHESVYAAATAIRTLALSGAIALATTGSLQLAGQPRDPATIAIAAGGILVSALLANNWLPTPLVGLYSCEVLYYTWRGWFLASRLLAPLVIAARSIEALVFRIAGRRPAPATEETLEDEIRTIVTEGHREGLLEEDAREMIEGVIELHDVTVTDVMTPRMDMQSLHVNDTLDRAAEFFVEVGHSRIPVYEKNRDEIIGILYSKDVLAQLVKPPAEREILARLLRAPVFVPESKAVDDLLQEFQRQRNHMAIVLDEFGGVAGLVTIEDVLEEIVGEIVDEHDDEVEEEIQRIDDRTSEVAARVRIDEVNEQLGLNIEEQGDFDTIGGFVFAELGHVPEIAEQLNWRNLRITVLELAHRRIERLRIEVLDETPSAPVHE
jgi:CBS domain containing-hemolysin-like protein